MDFFVSILVMEAAHLLVISWLKRRILCRLIAAEHQVQVYKRQVKRPTLKDRDRLFWVLLSKLWKGWRDYVTIVQPRAVLEW